MLQRVIQALRDPKSFWRQTLYNERVRRVKEPKEWLLLRHTIMREYAARREMPGQLRRLRVEEFMTSTRSQWASLRLIRPTSYNLSWEEVITLAQLVRAKAPRCLFEFGTFDGRTTIHLAMNAPDDAIVHTLDVVSGQYDFGVSTPFFEPTTVGQHFIGVEVERKIRQLTGDARSFDFTAFKSKVDFVFIDGDHSCEGVISDSRAAFGIIRPGGLVVWHDYMMIDDVSRALHEIAKTRELVHLRGTTLVAWCAPE